MPAQQEEVFEKVRTCLVDALGVDDEEVTPEASITADLGAESIDYLDILFRLEKTFNIKIPRGELFPEDILNNAEYVQDGKLSAEGLEQLKKRMSFADFSKFEKDPRLGNFVNLLTVQDMVNFVQTKLP
jgi:acyl carrier protein